jgi:putative membrane protein
MSTHDTHDSPYGILPPQLAKAIENQDNGTASTLLSTHRTGLADLRSHLANERTHLSYLRTCISLIGFGITINRFSIFMQEKENLVLDGDGPVMRGSEFAGAGMVVAGLILLMWSLYRYWHVNQDIVNARFRPLHKMVIGITAVLLVGGGATVSWLFLQH